MKFSGNNETSLGDALKLMIREYRLKPKLDRYKIQESWEKMVGPMIAKYTHRIDIKDNTIRIYIISAPLRNELQYAKSKILENIKKEMSDAAIDDIIIC